MSVSESPSARDTAVDQAPRVCQTCERPTPAHDPSEYTPARAAMILQRGLCLCPLPSPDGEPNQI